MPTHRSHRLAWLCVAALLSVGTAGCGSSATTPRNEADWAEAQQKAHEQIVPEETVLGMTAAREHETELAKAEYNVIVAREHAGG